MPVDPFDRIDEIIAMVETARAVPMSRNNCMIDRAEMIGVLDQFRAELPADLRRAAALAYGMSLGMVLIFAVCVRFFGWPTRSGPFNVWINLPLFDPTGGGDVLYRLRRDAGLNLVLGVLLPFAVPALVRIAAAVIGPVSLGDPQTLIWTVSAWAFLPATLLMRGIAMQRIAAMIEDKRRRSYAAARSPVEEGRALQGA